jgi:hypothetical protein
MNSRMWIVGLLVIQLATPLVGREKTDVRNGAHSSV